MIVSASRRTDIPAFYSEWFLHRLRTGFVYVRNPMNFRQVSKVELSPHVIDCIVFWTKNPQNMLKCLEALDTMGYLYYFQFTVTPYGEDLERGLPKKAEVLEIFKRLSDKIGKRRVVWRYDPIIINQKFTVSYHLDSFAKMCAVLSDYTAQCVFSFLDIYAKIQRRLEGAMICEIQQADREHIAAGFSKIAQTYKLELAACSERMSYQHYGIKAASCIDKKRIESIIGYPLDIKADANQRPACGCVESIDVGAYNCCGHLCLYCYANHSADAVEKNRKRHNMHAPLLIGNLSGEEIVTVRKVKSCKINEIALF